MCFSDQNGRAGKVLRLPEMLSEYPYSTASGHFINDNCLCLQFVEESSVHTESAYLADMSENA